MKLREKFSKTIKAIKQSDFFDKDWYVSKYPEASRWKGGPAAHYYDAGWEKGLDPSPWFSTSSYFCANRDVYDHHICPLLHYELFGKYEARPLVRLPEGVYESLKKKRALNRAVGKFKYSRQIKRDKNVRILVVLHLVHSSSFIEICEYLKNLQPYHYDLIVTYSEEDIPEAVLECVRNFKHDVTLKPYRNSGANIVFYDVLKTLNLDDYDIVFKLHSKGTGDERIFIYKQFFEYRDWFLYLYEGILGAETVHETIEKLCTGAQTGIVAAENLIVEDPPQKAALMNEYLAGWGLSPIKEYLFVAGGCFAAVAKRLKAAQALDIDIALKSSSVFSPDEALERLFCITACQDGYSISGNEVLRKRYLEANKDAEAFNASSAEQLYKDERFVIDDEYFHKELGHRFLEKYEFTTLPLRELKLGYTRDIRDAMGYKAGIVGIDEAAPAKYLENELKVYRAYQAYHLEHGLPCMTEKEIDELNDKIRDGGYDSGHPIIIDGNNFLLDGQYSAACLYHLFGIDFEAPVLKLWLHNENANELKAGASLPDRASKNIIAVSMVKNEEDIIELFCRYALGFCDKLIILEDNSDDRTPEILQSLIDEGLPIVVTRYEFSTGFYKYEKMNKLAEDAFLHHGADLVIPIDADEFITTDMGIPVRNILERLRDDKMYLFPWRTYVLTEKALQTGSTILERFDSFRPPELEPQKKTVISRALFINDKYRIQLGQHDLDPAPESPPREKIVSKDLVFAHFPLRSVGQANRKIIIGWLNYLSMPETRAKSLHWPEIYETIKKTGGLSVKQAEKYSYYYSTGGSQDGGGHEFRGDLTVMPVDTSLAIEKGRLEIKYTPEPDDDGIGIGLILSHVEKMIASLGK